MKTKNATKHDDKVIVDQLNVISIVGQENEPILQNAYWMKFVQLLV